MPKLIVSIDGVVIKEVQLTKERTTLGRRPYNDVVIDNLAVSGEHAVLLLSGHEAQIEDLNSTNGTYVNGKAVRRQFLRHNDLVEIGKYKIKFLHEAAEGGHERSMAYRPSAPAPLVGTPTPAPAPAPSPMAAAAAAGASAPAPSTATPQRRAFDTPAPDAASPGPASIRVLSGGAAGREVALVKVVTTIGKPGVAVAAITRRPQGYVVVHVEGVDPPLLNGAPVGTTPTGLKNGDVLQLAGTQMQFIQTG